MAKNLPQPHRLTETQQANVTAARAALADTQLSLSYTRVVSPIDGIAGFRVANIGDYVGPSDATPLTTVSQVNPIYAEFPQRAAGPRIIPRMGRRSARAAEHRTRARDGTVYPTRGRASELDRQVDVTTGTVLARGVFPNPGNVLRPRQYARVRAVVEVKKGALLVPQRAVQDVQRVRCPARAPGYCRHIAAETPSKHQEQSTVSKTFSWEET
jgi:membrane fusion protein, multidrug efflux system